MEANEIKKALYKERPIAKIQEVQTDDFKSYVLYTTKLSNGKHICFEVPLNEYDEDKFQKEMPAQLLIRWLVC